MDLRLLVSEISQVPNIYDSARPTFLKLMTLGEVNNTEDIDALNRILSTGGIDFDISLVRNISMDALMSYANTARPYVDSSSSDFFI
jgi:hypothetical protein